MKVLTSAALICGLLVAPAMAENRIDQVRPDAPELAAYGDHSVGVRTIDLVNKDQIDILKVEDGQDLPRYDRPLTLEVWYPAANGATGSTTYENVPIRHAATKVKLEGRAMRGAEPDTSGGPFPLIIISHGYPGNRFLLSHLGENLASKGYVVASIDHTDSTYSDQAAFGSTLVNRSLDQTFVLDEMARLSSEEGDFLSGMIDADRTGLIGYSMGGYGAVITAGGGVAQTGIDHSWGAPAGTLSVHKAGSETHEALIDDRIKAVIAIAPWGLEQAFWDDEGLSGVRTPIFFMAGSHDDVSGYENGVAAVFEKSTGADRYLLTFANANHNAAAPMPAPKESWQPVDTLDFIPFEHYADAVWDTTRMNNIAQHFSTAWLGKHLKGDEEMGVYLDLVEDAGSGIHALNEDGTEKPEHSYWKGFADRTAKGLSLRHMDAAN